MSEETIKIKHYHKVVLENLDLREENDKLRAALTEVLKRYAKSNTAGRWHKSRDSGWPETIINGS